MERLAGLALQLLPCPVKEDDNGATSKQKRFWARVDFLQGENEQAV